MILFITSRTDIEKTNELDPANNFITELTEYYPDDCRALYICSDPDAYDSTDRYAGLLKESFEKAGFCFRDFRILDGRNLNKAAELTAASDLLILAGGHVPTQNAFFQQIGLKEMLKDYNGVIIGISAGSMNSAETVYAQPEIEGEAIDPAYKRFFPGLGLSKRMIIPHYQLIKDERVDGLHIFDDIALPDSNGREFYVLPDGSYILNAEGKEVLYGEAYLIKDGSMKKIADRGDVIQLN